MRTIKQFTNSAGHIDAGLIRAVIRQMGGFESFKESAPDICAHGIDGGFNGFIQYSDTVAFYGRNRATINAMAANMASELKEGGAIELIGSFGCLSTRSPKPGDYSRVPDYTADEIGATMYGAKSRMDTQISNALAWFAAEEVARAYVDALENEGGN
jgi:hypothetical protein